jgi:ribosomal protein S18 acetylase RimI-like enzyme
MVAGWDEGRAFGLVDDGALVGYGELWVDDDEVELARLIVDPARRRQGIGRQLVSRLAEVGRAYYTRTVFLRVHPDNDSAVRVYLAAGFRFVDDMTAAEWNEGQPLTYRWLVG